MAAGTAGTKKKYLVVTAQGETVEVQDVTRVDASGDGVSVAFYDGDEQVASFRSFGSYRRA